MKRIVKSVEPHDFVQWKKQDKMAHRATGVGFAEAQRAACRSVDALSDLCMTDIRKLLGRGPDGRFLAYYTTIRQVLRT
jgi:hypothetical protein